MIGSTVGMVVRDGVMGRVGEGSRVGMRVIVREVVVATKACVTVGSTIPTASWPMSHSATTTTPTESRNINKQDENNNSNRQTPTKSKKSGGSQTDT